MKSFNVRGPNAAGTTNKTAVTIIASSSIRVGIFDIGGGTDGTNPSDVQVLYLVQRFTAVGTAGSNPTPEPDDSSDVAAIATGGITHSGEPTYTASKVLWEFSGNMRSPFRWVAFESDKNLRSPATASNGIGVYLSTTNPSTSLTGSFVVKFSE